MTTAGVEITKVNIYDTFEAMRNTYNTGISWHAGNHPFNPGGTYSNNYGSAVPSSGSASGAALGELENGIGDTIVVGSTIINQFRSYAAALSAIRLTRLVKYYNTNGALSVTYDATTIAHLDGRYQNNMSGVSAANITAGNTISAANLDAFINALSSTINATRNSTVTFEEFFCHSSCHSSCHGSI